MPMFHFDGHPAGKQSVASPDDDACVPGFGRWPKNAERFVSDAIADVLRHAPGFREVEGAAPEETQPETTPETQPDAAPESTPDATEATDHAQGDA